MSAAAASSDPKLTPEPGRRLRRVTAWIAAGLVALVLTAAIAVTISAA